MCIMILKNFGVVRWSHSFVKMRIWKLLTYRRPFFVHWWHVGYAPLWWCTCDLQCQLLRCVGTNQAMVRGVCHLTGNRQHLSLAALVVGWHTAAQPLTLFLAAQDSLVTVGTFLGASTWLWWVKCYKPVISPFPWGIIGLSAQQPAVTRAGGWGGCIMTGWDLIAN